jgi:hypothetical protein
MRTTVYAGGAALGLLPLALCEAIQRSTNPVEIIPLAVLGVFLGLRVASRWLRGKTPYVG